MPEAITRLQQALKQSPNNKVLTVNLANAYMQISNIANWLNRLLYRYTFDNPDDPIGWQLVAENAAKQGNRA